MLTRKLSITVISLLFTALVFATNKDLEKDVTMVSYEQSWLDSKGTLALRNNTNEDIHNVAFQIIYLDLSGNTLHYEEYTKDVTIAPGMTKKLDIPAYEHSRNYHYYKSEGMYGGSPSFKIKFQLKDYNIKPKNKSTNTNISKNNSNLDKNDDFAMIIAFIAIVAVISLCIGMYVLVAIMAKKRNRSVALWTLISLLTTPILMIIILLCVGKNENPNHTID